MFARFHVAADSRVACVAATIAGAWPQCLPDNGDAHGSPRAGTIEAFADACCSQDLSLDPEFGVGIF